MYDRIMVAVSGGADSDVMIDLIERVGHPHSEIIYVFYDTGIEFAATKRHLDFLERKYGIKIHRYRASTPVPIGCRKFGLPFISKRVAGYISRLQRHGFQFEDEPFDVLYARYPRCKSALRWWCNEWGEGSQMNISRNKWLKEFMVENPPDFQISDKCCYGAKKNTAHKIEHIIRPDLNCQGIRKSEGGARATAYKSCFDEKDWKTPIDNFRPIFWLTDSDREAYEQLFGVTHSECYSKYGLKRTGCACCPFGRNFEYELKIAEQYEPNLFRAANHVFGESYDYTRKYREFVELFS